MTVLEIFLGETLVNKLELTNVTSEEFYKDFEDLYKQFKNRCSEDNDVIKHYAGLVAFYIVNSSIVTPPITVLTSLISIFLSDKELDNLLIIKQGSTIIKAIDFSWIRSSTKTKQLYC